MGLTVRGDQLDADPWLLACKNGVIDLRSGKIWPGKPKNLITRASPHEYTPGNTKPPLLNKVLDAIFLGNQELIDYFQRLIGYSITGLTLLHLFVVCFGFGRNGKSLLFELFQYVMGPLAGAIRPELLLDQGRTANPNAPNAAVMALKGIRIAIASETNEGAKISTAQTKNLASSDTKVGRHPHDKHETRFTPTHTLFLLTNNKPHAPAHDFAFWERVVLLPFEAVFVNREPQAENERRADPELPLKLQAEASAILGWMVEGCLLWQRDGLNPPPVVLAATSEYRQSEDLLGLWIEERCTEDPGAVTPSTDLFNDFQTWWESNIGKNPWKQRRFGDLLSKRYHKEKIGTVKYFGLKLRWN